MAADRYIQIDEEGFFQIDQKRLSDDSFGQHLLTHLERTEHGTFITHVEGHQVFVEAFDDPLVVHQIHRQPGVIWCGQGPYQYQFQFSLQNLHLDEWDRFHGYDTKGRPFVFNRSAQADFFNLVDDFDDDSITVEKIKVQLPSWLSTEVDTSDTQFWSERYRAPELPPWEMGRPTPALVDALAQLKLNKCRILVPGCGSGHDAAYLAQQGHIVTAVDYSPEAVALAQEKYGDIKNLTIRQSDVFNLDQNHWGHYDLIVEHTLFCAIPPQKRALLVEKWTKYLNEGGHLLAVFFVMDRKNNPPFGATEWELRQRLRKKFEFLYWTRWKQSEDWKKSVELVIYAKLWQSTPHFQ